VNPVYDLSALKKSANLSINADLLQKAKSLDINLSATLEAALAAEVKRRRSARWLAANKPSLDAYNAFVAKHGVFSDGLRGF
jgi:antitoxin CcdA